MWSRARYDLHLDSDQFFALTPRQFDALLKRHKSKVESNEFLFAQLTSWVANTGFKSAKKPTIPADFMPSHFGKTRPITRRARRIRRSPQAVSDDLERMMERAMAYQDAQVARGLG